MDQTPGSRSPSWPPRPLNPSYDADVRLWRWVVSGEKVETIIISVHQVCWVFILNQSFAHLQMHPIEKNFGLKTFTMMYVFEMLSKSSCFMNYWRNRFLFFFFSFFRLHWSWLPQQCVQNVWVGLKAAVSWIMDGIWSQSKHSPLCPLHTAPPMETHFRKRRQRKQGNGDKFIFSSNRISDWL